MKLRLTRPDVPAVVSRFMHLVILVLLIMMAAIVLLSTIRLGYRLVVEMLAHPAGLVPLEDLIGIFGLFLVVLIGVELVESIQILLSEDVVHVEIVLLVALIAIARKVITLELSKQPVETLLGIAAILVALGAAYYLIKRAGVGGKHRPPASPPDA